MLPIGASSSSESAAAAAADVDDDDDDDDDGNDLDSVASFLILIGDLAADDVDDDDDEEEDEVDTELEDTGSFRLPPVLMYNALYPCNNRRRCEGRRDGKVVITVYMRDYNG